MNTPPEATHMPEEYYTYNKNQTNNNPLELNKSFLTALGG